ncbi:MAG: PRC-barrel domain-containing protein [Rhodospirillales bacterium]
MKSRFLGAMLASTVALAAAVFTSDARAAGTTVAQLNARELRDKPVYDTRSQRVALLTDVTGSPGPNRQAILRTGGIMGIGSREVVLPLEKLDMEPDGRLVIHMSEDQLRLLPR